MTIEEIREELKGRRIAFVCEKTGLNPATIYRIVQGLNVPHKSHLILLEAFLKGKLNG